MAQSMKVLIGAKDVDQRVAVKKALFQSPDIEVVAEVATAAELIRSAREHNPDIVLIDQELDGDTDGIQAAEELSFKAPNSDMILMSKTTDQLTSRKAMLAGIRQIMPKPFQSDDLVEVVKLVGEYNQKKKDALNQFLGLKEERVHESRTVTIFSTKGGVGRTLVSLNLAVALRKMTQKKVAYVDLDLQFGDVAVMMHLKPRTTIAGLARELTELGDLDDELIKGYMTKHEESGVDVLCAPLKPEEAEMVKAEHVGRLLKKLSETYHFVIVDTPSYLSDTVLTSLELSDLVFLLLTMELPTLKDGKLMLEIMESFNYSMEKVKIILNREDPNGPFKIKDIEDTLGAAVSGTVPTEGGVVMPAVNEGEPFYTKSPEAKISKAMEDLAKLVIPPEEPAEGASEHEAETKKKK